MIYLRSEVLAEYNDVAGTGQPAQYIYAGSQRIALVKPDGDVLYYLNDHLGSARAIVNESGALVDEYKKFYAFGESADYS